MDATARRISSAYRERQTCRQHRGALVGRVTRPAPAPTTTHGTLELAAIGLAVLLAAGVGTLLHQPASSSPPSSGDVPRIGAFRGTEADGALPDGVTVFDDEHPGVANLDAELLRAVRHAATDAAADGIELVLNSGWRSPEHQERLRREAVAEHGSEQEAARWVATVETSAHVTGDAVDVGPAEAAAWLSGHGAQHGLCQIYDNEPWHYELRPRAVQHGCPPTYPDPTHDPRMQG